MNWLKKLGARAASNWRLKLILTPALKIGFFVPYFILQRLELFQIRTMPVTWLDRTIDFNPTWVYVYQSLHFFVPVLPWLALTREDLERFVRGLLILCSVSFVVFLFYPVTGPRPDGPIDHWAYQLLVTYDRPTNSFPSLHAGLTLYAFLYGWQAVVRGSDRRVMIGYIAVATGWTLAILYATIATRQHWALDLPGGLVLAWVAHRLAWRSESPMSASLPEGKHVKTTTE